MSPRILISIEGKMLMSPFAGKVNEPPLTNQRPNQGDNLNKQIHRDLDSMSTALLHAAVEKLEKK